MFYKTRRGCKVVPVEPFVIMSGHDHNTGFSRPDTDALLFNRVGLEMNVTRGYSRYIAQSSDLVVIHNFTGQDITKVDPAGIRTSIAADNPPFAAMNDRMFSNAHGRSALSRNPRNNNPCQSSNRIFSPV